MKTELGKISVAIDWRMASPTFADDALVLVIRYLVRTS
jgi:hypothetical protein